MRSPLRGEVWLVDLGLAAKVFPALVLSVPGGESKRALWYGADDLDGTVTHYEITHVLGDNSHHQELRHDQLLAMIRETGRQPIERDALYNPVAHIPLAASEIEAR